MGTGSFPGVKCGRGVLLTTHPLLVSRSWKSRAVPLPTLWGRTGPLTGTLYLLSTLNIIYTLQRTSLSGIFRSVDVTHTPSHADCQSQECEPKVTPCSRYLPPKLTVLLLVKKYPAILDAEISLSCSNRTPLAPLLSCLYLFHPSTLIP